MRKNVIGKNVIKKNVIVSIADLCKERCSPAFIKGALIATAAVCILTAVFSFQVLSAHADVSESGKREKYFKSIMIEEGDTLTSIAREYISDEYSGINDYIHELKRMNGLSGDTIHAGCNLVIAYYSDAGR